MILARGAAGQWRYEPRVFGQIIRLDHPGQQRAALQGLLDGFQEFHALQIFLLNGLNIDDLLLFLFDLQNDFGRVNFRGPIKIGRGHTTDGQHREADNPGLLPKNMIKSAQVQRFARILLRSDFFGWHMIV